MFLKALRPFARFGSAFRSLIASLPLAGSPPEGVAGFTYCLERCPGHWRGGSVKVIASARRLNLAEGFSASTGMTAYFAWGCFWDSSQAGLWREARPLRMDQIVSRTDWGRT